MKARSRDASVSFVFGHIARYAPSHEENICAPITYFQCKNNYEHLLNSGSVLLTRRALPLLLYTIYYCLLAHVVPHAIVLLSPDGVLLLVREDLALGVDCRTILSANAETTLCYHQTLFGEELDCGGLWGHVCMFHCCYLYLMNTFLPLPVT